MGETGGIHRCACMGQVRDGGDRGQVDEQVWGTGAWMLCYKWGDSSVVPQNS